MIYQKHKFKEEMKMTKQEVKDEYKILKETHRLREDSVRECVRHRSAE